MKIAFYIAKHGTIIDKGIAWWKRPNFWKFWKSAKYSHVEMYFSNGESFSSSPRDGGTRWKNIVYKLERWDFIDVTLNEETLKSLCIREEGKGYDWFCFFFTQFIPFNIQKRTKWICSEITACLAFNYELAFKYDPNSLYEKINKIN